MSRDLLEPEPYAFDEDFERTLVALSVKSLRFWMRIGREFDPELLASDAAKTVMKTARMVAAATSAPPCLMLVRQRLQTQYQEGKLGHDKHAAALAYLDVDIGNEVFQQSVLSEVLPMMQRRYGQKIAITAAGEYPAGPDFKDTRKLLESLASLGQDAADDDDDEVCRFSAKTVENDKVFVEDILNQRSHDKLPWGVEEVDRAIDGGLGRGQTMLVVARSGDGKTKSLTTAACTAIRAGRAVFFATLELKSAPIRAYILSNLSGMLYNDVLRDPQSAINLVRRKYPNADFTVKWFRPQRTTFDDIAGAMEHLMPDAEVLVLDYLDKLVSPERKARPDLSSYREGNDVAEAWRMYVEARKLWSWSASQSRRAARNKQLDNEDVADSKAKIDTGDNVMMLTHDIELDLWSVFLSKVRFGKTGVKLGPYTHDWARGRMVPLDDEV